MYYIGNHLSASKGFAAMGRAAVKLGGNTFAFFTRNPRGGKAKAIDEKDIEKFLGTKVYLQLWVKVKKEWRDSLITLKDLGYK